MNILSLEGACRLCLTYDPNNVNLFGEFCQSHDFQAKVWKQFAVWVHPEENLPKTICVHCCQQVEDFYSFALKVDKVQQQIFEMLPVANMIVDEFSKKELMHNLLYTSQSSSVDNSLNPLLVSGRCVSTPEANINLGIDDRSALSSNVRNNINCITSIATTLNTITTTVSLPNTGIPLSPNINLSDHTVTEDDLYDKVEENLCTKFIPQTESNFELSSRYKSITSTSDSVEIKVEVDPEMIQKCDNCSDSEHFEDSESSSEEGEVSMSDCKGRAMNSISNSKAHSVMSDSCGNTVTPNEELDQNHIKNDEVYELTPENVEKDSNFEEDSEDESGDCNSSIEEGDEKDCDFVPDECDASQNMSTVKKKLNQSESSRLREQLAEFYEFTCDMCAEEHQFQNFHQLDKHYRARHNVKGYIKCCGTKLHVRHVIVNHMMRHLQPGIFGCHECGKEMANRKSLEKHLITHLPESERPFKCPHCNKGFPSKAAVQTHEVMHLSDEERLRYVCDICGKRFRRGMNLLNHKKFKHQDCETFMCHICAKTFVRRNGLDMHLHTHTTNERVQCPECGKWLKNNILLRIHMKCHQGKLYPCPHCDKVYNIQHSLSSHLKSHSDERPYKCNICSKTFKRGPGLKTHMVQHTGEKPYTCPYCPRRFGSSGNFSTHKKRMHSQEEVSRVKRNAKTVT